MKIEIDIRDLEDIFFDDIDGEYRTETDLKKAIVNLAVSEFIGKLYDDFCVGNTRNSIRDEAREFVKFNSNEIIDKVIENVTEEILRKKRIASEIPKKSEIANIDKEWEKYFTQLIDKSIAKKFKSFGE